MDDFVLADVLRGQLQGQAAPAEATRDIAAVTCEILHLKQELARNIVDIGLRLIEAKEMLSHGEWLPWPDRAFRTTGPWITARPLSGPPPGFTGSALAERRSRPISAVSGRTCF